MARILIVDDSYDDADLLNYFLKQEGLDFCHALSGSEALVALKSEKFSLIISDYQMPNGDGLWLLDKLKSHIDPPACILVSADSGMSEKRAMEAGAKFFLSKPVDYSRLKIFIHQLMSQVEA